MQLTVTRITKTDNSTIGEFAIDGKFFSYCLEPTDRGLTSDMTLEQIAAIKVANKTCIPTGEYNVTKYFSPKHNAEVPLIENIPGFAFVEIHVGNYPKDTDACLLLGYTKDTDFVGGSKDAITDFYRVFFEALDKGEQVSIEYEDVK